MSSVTTTLATIDDLQAQQRIAAGEFDLLIALGGDGTMLRAGHLAARWDCLFWGSIWADLDFNAIAQG